MCTCIHVYTHTGIVHLGSYLRERIVGAKCGLLMAGRAEEAARGGTRMSGTARHRSPVCMHACVCVYVSVYGSCSRRDSYK